MLRDWPLWLSSRVANAVIKAGLSALFSFTCQSREALKRRVLTDPAPLSFQELSLLANAARRGIKVVHGEEYERNTLGYIGNKELEKIPK